MEPTSPIPAPVSPVPRPSPVRTAALLVLALAALLPPYLIYLGQPSPVRSMETICMHTSVETWLRGQEGEVDAWQTPSLRGGLPRIEKPPLLVWLNLLAWHGLDPATSSVETLAWRARAVTVALVLLGAAAAGAAGCLLAGRRAGLLASLITGTIFLVIKQGHYATYDAQLMGWAALAVVAGLWAMQPLCPERAGPRHVWGWLLGGVALGAGLMTKGPVALVLVILPLTWAVVLTPQRRRRHIWGLLAMLAVGAALSAWWFVHVRSVVSDPGRVFALEYLPVDRDQQRPLYYYALLVGLVFPWSLWWVYSWFQPFREPDRVARRPLLLAWGWCATTLLAACAFPMRHERYLVPIMPAVGVMCALWFRAQEERFRTTPAPAWLARSWHGMWLVAALLSLVGPAGIALQPWLLAHGLIKEALTAAVAWPACLAAAVVLLAGCWCGWRQARQRQYIAAATWLALWMVALSAGLYYGYARAADQQYPNRADAERLAAACRGTPVYYVWERQGKRLLRPAYGVFIYSKRVIRPVRPEALPELARGPGLAYVLATADSAGSRQLSALGLPAVLSFRDGQYSWQLFRAPAAALPAAP